jgi:hypothetical protein
MNVHKNARLTREVESVGLDASGQTPLNGT